MTPSTWRKKPVTVQAVQFLLPADTRGELLDWVRSGGGHVWQDPENDAQLLIWTLEGTHIVSLGDWVIRGVEGEFYACKPHIFERTYEAL